MRSILATALALAVTLAPLTGEAAREERGNLVLDGVPAPDPALAARLDAWLQARGADTLDWLGDDGLLIATRFGVSDQVHLVSQPFGAREQLTFHDEPIGTARAPATASPAGFVYTRDRGGDENRQLYWYSLAERSARMLTDGKSRNEAPVWSNDGKRVAFRSNARDGVAFDVYMTEPAGGGLPRLLVSLGRVALEPLDWSPDDARVLVKRETSINESFLYVVEVATGAVTPLTPEEERFGVDEARFARDGRGVYLVSNRGSEFRHLRYLDLASGEERVLTGHIPWDIETFALSRDGRYLAYVANIEGTSRLTVLDQGLKLELTPANLPAGLISGLRFEPAGARLAFSLVAPQSPRDAWVFDPSKNELVRWTRSELGPVDASKLVAPTLVRYPTWDRAGGRPRNIPAYVYRPTKPGPHPVLIDIHGGPESQYRPGFDLFTQFVVNELGYAVVFPNVRGSSGYGRTYLDLDNGRQREDAVRDIGSLLVWIGQQRDFDPKRVVVRGGSYGGYMTLATLVHFGDRVRGGIDTVGISNFVTFLRNTSPYRQDQRRAEYGDERDPSMRAFLDRISPLTHATAIRKPLLIVQGLNDPRVPASESEQLVAKVRSRGGEVWYLAAKDEGHGFRKKPNRDFYLLASAAFLERMAKSPP